MVAEPFRNLPNVTSRDIFDTQMERLRKIPFLSTRMCEQTPVIGRGVYVCVCGVRIWSWFEAATMAG